jgi:hypothetical protein
VNLLFKKIVIFCQFYGVISGFHREVDEKLRSFGLLRGVEWQFLTDVSDHLLVLESAVINFCGVHQYVLSLKSVTVSRIFTRRPAGRGGYLEPP